MCGQNGHPVPVKLFRPDALLGSKACPVLFGDLPHDLAGDAGSDHACGNVFRPNAARANDGAITDGYALKDGLPLCRVCSEACVVAVG